MMPYFNGGLHGWNDSAGYHPPAPCTARYCDGCAEDAIPLAGNSGDVGRHWKTGFKWAPYYGGDAPCDCCGKPVDARDA
jgi:hypothetical protein